MASGGTSSFVNTRPQQEQRQQEQRQQEQRQQQERQQRPSAKRPKLEKGKMSADVSPKSSGKHKAKAGGSAVESSLTAAVLASAKDLVGPLDRLYYLSMAAQLGPKACFPAGSTMPSLPATLTIVAVVPAATDGAVLAQALKALKVKAFQIQKRTSSGLVAQHLRAVNEAHRANQPSLLVVASDALSHVRNGHLPSPFLLAILEPVPGLLQHWRSPPVMAVALEGQVRQTVFPSGSRWDPVWTIPVQAAVARGLKGRVAGACRVVASSRHCNKLQMHTPLSPPLSSSVLLSLFFFLSLLV